MKTNQKELDIRTVLQKVEEPIPIPELDAMILSALHIAPMSARWSPSLDYNLSIKFIEEVGCDWIIANVNGHMGGTPFAKVGESPDSYAATPLLSLWLAYFRFQLGDERLI